jgi:glycosyltransferase involved in cell wall biosynthesis
MRYALEHLPFDTMTIVDSDQLAVRPGWSEHLGRFLEQHPRAGLLGNAPFRQPPHVEGGAAAMPYREIELWRPWLRRFPGGEEKFVHWTFWPSTVITAAAARDLVRLFDDDAQLREILGQSRVWATEEIFFPTFTALLGYEVAASPCSYDYVQFRKVYTPAQIAAALERPDVFWVHPVPRRFDDPLRRMIRERWNGYETPSAPLVSCIMPTHNRRELVPQAIRQFQRQDWPNAELIVVDDGTDKVADLIPADPRIRYLALDERRTVGAKRNLACEVARGEIILHWDDDDWMADWRIRYQAEHLLSSEADLSGLPRIYFHEPATGGTWEFTSPARRERWIAGATFCYRKEVWRANPFEDVDVGEDMRFLWNGPPKKVSQLGDPGFYVARLHPGNTSSKRDTGRAWRRVSDQVLAPLLEEERPVAPATAVAVTSSPLVSCIMPTRDRKELALRAIDYFLRQDWPERELVIVDDGAEPLPVPQDERIRHVRLEGPATIGRKRNLGVEQSCGEIIVHWDDDDWYAPDRIRHQIEPLLAGEADIAGLTAEHFFSSAGGTFWGCTPQLHARMFFADVHGRSLAYARKVWGRRASYPDLSLAEDARFLQAALHQGSRLARRPNPDKFVYVRHGANTWQFECGEFLQPAGWKAREVPGFIPEGDLAFYRGLVAEGRNSYPSLEIGPL